MKETLINYKWKLNLLDFRAALPQWGFWEKERLDAMYKAIRPGDHVVDIGAEQGDMSALFKKWVGRQGKITLIEPSPGFWPNMKATFEANDMEPFNCWPILASNKSDIDYLINIEEGAIRPNEWPKEAHGETSDNVGFSHINEKPKIPQVKIDDMRLPKVDHITIDTEGTEYEIFQGAEETIKRDKPILFVSVHPEFMWKEFHHSPDDLHVMLDHWGYDANYLAFDHEQHYLYKARPE